MFKWPTESFDFKGNCWMGFSTNLDKYNATFDGDGNGKKNKTKKKDKYLTELELKMEEDVL